MPRVEWGVSARDVDDFDREAQYKPYDGPLPANGVYQWRVKSLKHIAATEDKNPQLRIGLELVPRKGRKSERAYAGYFVTVFAPVNERTAFRYVPFLDAIGVSGKAFKTATITDQEGNIRKIGRWVNNGDTLIKAELKSNTGEQADKYPKDIGWMGELTEEDEADDEEFDEEDDDEFDDEYDGEDDEEEEWD